MIEPGTGTLLIADPFLKDHNFMRTVLLICRHSDEGSFGFVINKLYELTLEDLFTDMQGFQIPVFIGGPVQLDTIHYIHQYPDLLPDSQEITDDIFWGGDFEALKKLIREEKIEIEKVKFFIGYSGWEPGQLDSEMEERSWLAAPSNVKLVFHTNTDDLWKASLRHLGGKYEMMINFPIDPQLN
jgi:putative transcriptional regulator